MYVCLLSTYIICLGHIGLFSVRATRLKAALAGEATVTRRACSAAPNAVQWCRPCSTQASFILFYRLAYALCRAAAAPRCQRPLLSQWLD